MTRIATLVVASILSLAGSARAAVFANDAGTVGRSRLSIGAGLSVGSDLLLSERSNAIGAVLRADVGFHDRFSIGGWLGSGFGNHVCIDYPAGSPYSSDCFWENYEGGGAVARLGLLQLPLVQLGVEIGLGVRRFEEWGEPAQALRLDGAALASVKLGPVGLVYGRAGMAWHYLDDSVITSKRRLPYGVVGLELLPFVWHPFVEVSYARLSYSAEGKDIGADKWALTAGVTVGLE
ncbi:MAG: hypothetical protein ACOX6T_17100 [Myxococcales bacterium]|jgi:hypothetical protein